MFGSRKNLNKARRRWIFFCLGSLGLKKTTTTIRQGGEKELWCFGIGSNQNGSKAKKSEFLLGN